MIRWPMVFMIVSVSASSTFAEFTGDHSDSVLDSHAAALDTTEMTVYKSPTCGCCRNWVEHVRRHGFSPVVKDTSDVTAVKTRLGVPANLRSCHTAVVAGYVIEGHVPAEVIQRLLRERPDVAGIAVAGMPAGSPGMETGGEPDSYDVMSFARDGTSRVYEKR